MSRGGRGRGRGGIKVGGNPALAFGNFGNLDKLNLVDAAAKIDKKPELYPDFELPVPDKVRDGDKELLSDYRALLNDFKQSPSYLRHSTKIPRIERYSDKYLKEEPEYDPDAPLTHITTDLSFFPTELHSSIDQSKVTRYTNYNPDVGKEVDKIIEMQEKENEDEEEQEEDHLDDAIEGDDGDYTEQYFDNGEGEYESDNYRDDYD